MSRPQAQRITRELTADEQQRLEEYRRTIAEERDDLIARDRMRKEARDEATLSGELRRAVHDSDASLSMIANTIGVTPLVLDEFLTGERTLRSDVLDRLAVVLGYELFKAS